jgi:hypothetical protein
LKATTTITNTTITTKPPSMVLFGAITSISFESNIKTKNKGNNKDNNKDSNKGNNNLK